MHALLSGVGGELRVMFCTRLGVALLTLLAVLAVFTGSIYRELVLRDIPVAVVDLDGTKLSRALTTQLNATPELRVVRASGGSIQDARTALERGELAAVVIFEPAMTRTVKRGRHPYVLLATDSSNMLVDKSVRAAVARVVTTTNVGLARNLLRKLGMGRDDALARALPIALEENQMFNPATNYAEYLVPLVESFLVHVYFTVLFAGVFLDPPRGRGWQKRGHRLGRHVAIVVWVTVLGVALWISLPQAGVVVASSWIFCAAAFLGYSLAQGCLVVALATVTPKPELGFQITLFPTMLAMMLSGATWPQTQFPAPLAALSEALPYTPLVRLFRIFVHFEASWQDALPHLTHLAWLGAGWLGLALAASALRGVLALLHRRRTTHEPSPS